METMGCRTMSVNPAHLRFTQVSIQLYFQYPHNYLSITEGVRRISKGEMTPADFPSIRVVSYNGRLWSIDNRRLWVFRLARCKSISVQLVTEIHPRLEQIISNPYLLRMMEGADFFPRVRGVGIQAVVGEQTGAGLLRRKVALHDFTEEDLIIQRLAAWPNGKKFDSISDAEVLRDLSFPAQECVQKMTDRRAGISFETDDPARWKRIWNKNGAIYESSLVWQMMFPCIASNSWRFLSFQDPLSRCVMCPLKRRENKTHLFWSCPTVRPVWKWVTQIFISRLPHGTRWTPSVLHAVLGNLLPEHIKHLQEWWDLVCGSTLWALWIRCNGFALFNPLEPSGTEESIAIQIWSTLRHYMEIDAKLTLDKCTKEEGRTAELIRRRFQTKWGPAPVGPSLVHNQILLPALPFAALLR